VKKDSQKKKKKTEEVKRYILENRTARNWGPRVCLIKWLVRKKSTASSSHEREKRGRTREKGKGDRKGPGRTSKKLHWFAENGRQHEKK